MNNFCFIIVSSSLVILRGIKGKGEEMPSPINSLSGKHLKVAFPELGSSAQVYRNATGHVVGYGGVFWEELTWLSLKLNFSFEVQQSSDNSFGSILKNGSWTGMRGQIQRGEIDLACNPNAGSVANDIVEMAVYILGDSYGIFIRYPTPVIKNDGAIRVFSINVWIGLLISTIACITCIKLLDFLTIYLFPDQYENIKLSSTWLYIIGTLTNHAVSSNNGHRNGPRSSGILAFIWLLATFVFVNIYSSCLASYMSLRFQRPAISTFEDLANDPVYKPSTIKGISLEFIFLEAKSGTMLSKIGDKLRQCGDGCRHTRNDVAIEKVFDGNYAAILTTTLGNFFIRKHISNRECKLTMGQSTMNFVNLFFGVPKSSPYVMEFNKGSFWWHSFGLQQYWMKKFGQYAPRQCMLQYNNQGVSVQLVDRARLTLGQFFVAFIVLIIGYAFGVIQFLRERFIRNGRP